MKEKKIKVFVGVSPYQGPLVWTTSYYRNMAEEKTVKWWYMPGKRENTWKELYRMGFRIKAFYLTVITKDLGKN